MCAFEGYMASRSASHHKQHLRFQSFLVFIISHLYPLFLPFPQEADGAYYPCGAPTHTFLATTSGVPITFVTCDVTPGTIWVRASASAGTCAVLAYTLAFQWRAAPAITLVPDTAATVSLAAGETSWSAAASRVGKEVTAWERQGWHRDWRSITPVFGYLQRQHDALGRSLQMQDECVRVPEGKAIAHPLRRHLFARLPPAHRLYLQIPSGAHFAGLWFDASSAALTVAPHKASPVDLGACTSTAATATFHIEPSDVPLPANLVALGCLAESSEATRLAGVWYFGGQYRTLIGVAC